MTAGFSPEQLQSFEMMKSNVGMTNPYYKSALEASQGTAQYQPSQVTAQNFLQGDVSAYMNPYLQNVEDRAVANAQRTLELGRSQIGDAAAKASAFGGSRQGIAEGVAAAEGARNIGDLSGQLRAGGYNQAAQLLSSDQARAQQAQQANQAAGLQAAGLRNAAAGMTADIAGKYQQAGALDAAMLGQIGEQKQSLEQQQLMEAYQRWAEERNYPIEGLNLLLSATSSSPYGKTTTSTGGSGGGSNFLTGLGAVGSAASTAMTIASLAAM